MSVEPMSIVASVLMFLVFVAIGGVADAIRDLTGEVRAFREEFKKFAEIDRQLRKGGR